MIEAKMADISPLSSQGPATQQMAWSARSAELARGAAEKMQSAGNQDERSTILNQGLTSIAKDQGTTADEKALASMALSYSSMSMNSKAITTARNIVFSAFTSPIGGSLGTVIGKISLDSIKSMSDVSDKNSLLSYNMRALTQGAGAPQVEKKLADLGLSYSSMCMNTDAMAAARGCIASALAASCTSPIGHALADVMLKADTSIKNGGDRNYSFYYGIKKIDDELPAAAPEKALTKLGLTYSSQLMNTEAILEARKSIANKLSAPLTDTAERTVIAASLDAYPRIREKSDRNNMLYYALRAVQERLPDGAPEKALANLGLTYSSQLMNTEAIVEARKSLADKLSAPLTDTPERTIIAASLDAFMRIREKGDRNNMLYYALKAIQGSLPDGTPEKALTNLGLTYSSQLMNTEAILEARKSIADALSKPRGESPVKLICTVSSDAVSKMTELNDRNSCLYYAFKAIGELPGASAAQKEIARRATSLSSLNNTTQEILRKRQELMQEILSVKDPLDELKEMAANLAKPADTEAIVKDDDEDFISIDGVKLEVKNTATQGE
jgi:hypothetical protein